MDRNCREESSVMARMQKKFWKTKQVLIKVTGKKEDECVIASDAELDSKLEPQGTRLLYDAEWGGRVVRLSEFVEFFHSVQTTCAQLQKVTEKYQQSASHLSREENELGLFLRFQAEQDRTRAGSMMEATSKALCASAKLRLALAPPLRRMEQEVETFRRRAIADSLLTVGRMERARTEYRAALLWMKDVSQELDPDTHKQLEKFRKVQAQVKTTKSQFDKLKNDVCQKVDVLGASRCNLLSHSLCTYQTTLLHSWEQTSHMMSGIQEAFKGYTPYQFTTLKELQDPLEQPREGETQDEGRGGAVQDQMDKLISLDEEKPGALMLESAFSHGGDGQSRDSDSSACASFDLAWLELTGPLSTTGTADDLLFQTSDTSWDLPQPLLFPGLLGATDPSEVNVPVREAPESSLGALSGMEAGDLLLDVQQQPGGGEGDWERKDLSFLSEILSPGATGSDEFIHEWRDAFCSLESAPPLTGTAPAPSPTPLGSPTGFLPSQLLDRSLSSTGWATPPMFQAPPMQASEPTDKALSSQTAPKTTGNGSRTSSRDMSAWFDLFADLDPLANPDAIGRPSGELLNA